MYLLRRSGYLCSTHNAGVQYDTASTVYSVENPTSRALFPFAQAWQFYLFISPCTVYTYVPNAQNLNVAHCLVLVHVKAEPIHTVLVSQ